PPQDVLSGTILDDGQRSFPKRLQDPLCSRLVSHLLLVFRVQTRELGVIVLQRPPQDKLHDRQHADTERQQVREALDLIIQLDTQGCDLYAALEAIAEAFDWR